MGARGREWSWLSITSFNTRPPSKIAQDKMLSWSHVLLETGRRQTSRGAGVPPETGSGAGLRTTFTRNLAPEALLSHRGACSPSSITSLP